ncbi:hypothetical protein M9H77_31071 [Catharanthus roseus]|uniref:Uncharacterized protein n=1 Tax=Catharanthus roseus TaxID=4058 RepID=A0ACB9ZZW4_CATRO|nr:hypothetical protein M9H77_31071 [Catharanthus roseus]
MLFSPEVKTMKGNKNGAKRRKWSRRQQISQPTARGKLIYHHWFCGTKGIGKQRPIIDGRPRPTVGNFDLQLGDLKDELGRRSEFQLRLQFLILSFLFPFFYLPIAFVCNLIIARLDYLQGCSKLKKKKNLRQPIEVNWGN